MASSTTGSSPLGADPGAVGSRSPEAVTLRLLSLSGAPVQLEPLSLDATVRDLALEVRARLRMPISVQNLIHGTDTLTDPSARLADVFGQLRSAEITVVRRPFTPRERAQLHTQLVRAAAGGQMAQLRELLLEGAQVNFKAEGHCVDTSVSLSRWETLEVKAGEPGAPRPERAEAEATGEAQGLREHHVGEDIGSEMSDDLWVGAAPGCEENPCGGLTPLLVAIAVGDQELAQDLRQLGAEEPDMTTRHADLTAAFRHMDFVDVVKHLAAGADVNTRLTRDHGIGTGTAEGAPLHACAAHARRPGAFEVAQILIRKNADMSSGDSEGDNPMAHARFFGAFELFQLFKGHGAKIEGPYFHRFGRF